MAEKPQHPYSALSCIMGLASAALAATLGPAAAQNAPAPDRQEFDNACAMLSAFAHMGVSLDRMKQVLPTCARHPDARVACNTVLVFNITIREGAGNSADVKEAKRLLCSDLKACGECAG